MSVYVRIFSDAADTGGATSLGLYSTTRNETPAWGTTTSTTQIVGQTLAGGNAICYQALLVFDTSTLSTSLTTGTLSISAFAVPTTLGDTLEARAVAGSTTMVAGDSLAAQTPLYGTLAFPNTTGRKNIALTSVGSMARGTGTQVLLHSQKQRTATAPTTNVERLTVSMADQTGTTDDPYMDFVGGWSLVGVGSLPTPGTTLTLTEPAGVANGDLLIACIASRSTATTAPTITGWTAVGSQNNNNTLTTGSAIASGAMLYQIRSGTPTLAVTIPSGVSVVMGQIVAYRGSAATTPLDVSTAVTMAAGTAVSVTGLTTTQDDDLIVAMAAGGQEAAWSAFTNVTTPLTASGATDTTTIPSTTAWIERADNVTTTGADTSLGIFDAVRTGTGATGNLTVTASVSAGHVVIAGAFKIYRSIADAWNIDDKSGTLTLSNSDKTATSGGTSYLRSTQVWPNETAGKFYAEFAVDARTDILNLGFQRTASLITSASNSTDLTLSTGGIRVSGSASGVSLGGALGTGDVICLAWDAGAETVWYRANGGLWNNDASADPATGVNGVAVNITAGSCALKFATGTTSGQVVTLRTELAEFTQAVPSGFVSWMGEAPSVADAWNANDKSAFVTLSNSDKTATSGAATQGVRSTTLRTNGTAGKYYAEFLCGSTVAQRMGITPTSNTLTATSANFHITGANSVVNGTTNFGTIGTACVSGDVLCVAWDAGAEKVWFRKNGNDWENTAGHDPATGTGGFDCSFAASTDHALWTLLNNSGTIVTVRTELADFTQAVPSGFSSWMGETPAGGGVTVAATGVAAGSAVGTVTVVLAPVSFEAVGAAAATALGTATASGKSNVSTEASGVTAAAAIGTATATGITNISTVAAGVAADTALGTATVATVRSESVTPAGVTAPAAVGSVSVAAGGGIGITPTGVTAGTIAGSVTVAAAQNISTAATGVTAAAVSGTATVSGAAQITAVGVTAGTAVGAVSVAAIQSITTTPTGQTAATALGGVSVAVGGGVSIPASGFALASALGTVSVTANQAVTAAPAGVSAGTAAGTASVSIHSTVAASGVTAAALVGTPTVTAKQAVSVAVTGVSASVELGGISVAAGGSVGVIAAGQSVTALLGNVSVTANQVVSFTPVGVSAGSAIGAVSVSGAATATPTGVSAPIILGTVTASASSSIVVTPAGQIANIALGNVSVAVGGGIDFTVSGHFAATALGEVTITATVADIGTVGVWTGVGWAQKPAKVWTGSAWTQKPVKAWNGSEWV